MPTPGRQRQNRTESQDAQCPENQNRSMRAKTYTFGARSKISSDYLPDEETEVKYFGQQ